MRAIALMVLLCVAGVFAGGCASATAVGFNPGLDGVDLQQMTDAMAQSIAGDPQVQQAIAEHGPLRVVLLPVENYMTGEILPAGQKHAFVARVRSLLAKNAPRQFIWIANRDAYLYARRMELEGVQPGPDPDAMQPKYALTARFDSLTNVDARVRSSSYLCSYELIDLETREVLWQDKYELKKTAVRGFLD